MSDQGTTFSANFNKWVNGNVLVNMQLWKPVSNALPKVYFYCDNSSPICQPVPPYFNPLDFACPAIDDPNTDICANIGGGGVGGNNSMIENILNGDWVIDGYESSTDEIAKTHLYTFLMASDEDLENDVALIDKRNELNTQAIIQQFILDFENSDLGDLNTTNLQLAQGNITQAALSNAVINSTDAYVIKAKLYNDLYIQYIENEDILSDSVFVNNILSIATSCPLEYGNTVYLAQAMYHLINPYALFQDDDKCNMQAARKTNQVKPKKNIAFIHTQKLIENKLDVYPNPNDGEFRIRLDETGSTINVSIELINTLGQKVYSNTNTIFENGIAIIKIGNLPDGIYQLLLFSAATSTQNKTVIINRK
jgi:hypothetical protein